MAVPENIKQKSVEPFGSQLLRKLHTDGHALLKDYDAAMPDLEHEEIKAYVQSHLQGIEKHLTAIEKMHKRHYKDMEPLAESEPGETGQKAFDKAQIFQLFKDEWYIEVVTPDSKYYFTRRGSWTKDITNAAKYRSKEEAAQDLGRAESEIASRKALPSELGEVGQKAGRRMIAGREVVGGPYTEEAQAEDNVSHVLNEMDHQGFSVYGVRPVQQGKDWFLVGTVESKKQIKAQPGSSKDNSAEAYKKGKADGKLGRYEPPYDYLRNDDLKKAYDLGFLDGKNRKALPSEGIATEKGKSISKTLKKHSEDIEKLSKQLQAIASKF